jgi:sigma-E factor negative regulatory protein RseB
MRTAWVVSLTLALAPAAHAASEEARAWIARMNEALSTRNYDGVFTHQVGSRREVLRIIHRVQNGRMAERLVATDGSGREFVRNGAEWVAYFPDRRMAMVETRNRSYGFISTLKGLSDESERYYTLRTEGAKRVQGAMTQQINVEPRDALRFGYRLWLDQKTAMPMRTQLVAQSGEIIEEIAFISLSLPQAISDELLKPDVDTTGFRWLRRDKPARSEDVKVQFQPQAEMLPPGFRVRIFNPPDAAANTKGERSRFLISDGIAWVSVFIESAAPSAQPRLGTHGSSTPTSGVVQMGSAAAYVSDVDGYRVTVVGEVPASTVKSIAQAMRPE